jgi:1-acyl-sn-glycerol-3-phosphate acyltransferase
VNLWVPPYWVRRLVVVPSLFILISTVLSVIPLGLALLLIFSFLIPGKWRPLRLAGFALVYAVLQYLGLIAAFGLWLISGFGWRIRSPWFVDRHYGLLRFMLAGLVLSARWMFRLHIVAEDDEPETVHVLDSGLLVLSRHAGPGDSFLLVDRLLRRRRLRPRIVLKHTLQWDPFIDVVLNRLPSRFVDNTPGAGQRVAVGIAELATDLGPRDAVVIFPEGGNFTPKRRLRAIERLRAAGLEEQTDQAERLHNLLPPRPIGVYSATTAAPRAGIAVVGHTGLDRLQTLRDVWRELPSEKTLLVTWRWFAPDDVPDSLPELTRWLNSVWAGVDGWISRNQPPDVSAATSEA